MAKTDPAVSSPSKCTLRQMLSRRTCMLLLLVHTLVIYWIFVSFIQPVQIFPAPLALPRSPSSHLVSGEAVFHGSHLVHTDMCHIPNSDAFDGSLRQFIVPPQPIECDRDRKPPLTFSDIGSVYFLPGRQHLYGARPPEAQVLCCTRDVSWDSSVSVFDHKHGIDRVVLSKQCTPLTDSYSPATASGVQVTCELNGTEVYRDYYHFAPPAPAPPSLRHKQDVRLSVLVVFFDAVSRLQFSRWFPESRRFLSEELGAFELAGLNKEADNTWPNMVPLLTGGSVEELMRTCANAPDSMPLDECPFMWKEFKTNGYKTVLFEDSANIGTFTFMKVGFDQQPTDYYSMPTRLLMEKQIGHTHPVNTFFCFGTRRSPDISLKYILDLGRRLAREPYWAAVLMDSFTHDKFAMPGLLDRPYRRVLEALRDAGALNNTVLVTMGDHGLRWGKPRETFIGGLEERLPLMSLAFPVWFRRYYPTAFANLRHNQHRLTTFRDVHKTLLALIDPEKNLGSVNETEVPESTPAVNLFQRVSPLRRCNEAQIPAHFCACLVSTALSVGHEHAIRAAQLAVASVNQLLTAAPQCQPLRLKNITDARYEMEPPHIHWREKWPLRKIIRVKIVTEPGEGHMEATTTLAGNYMELSGTVNRNDRIGGLVWCIKDHIREKYCHCGSNTTETNEATNSSALSNTTAANAQANATQSLSKNGTVTAGPANTTEPNLNNATAQRNVSSRIRRPTTSSGALLHPTANVSESVSTANVTTPMPSTTSRTAATVTGYYNTLLQKLGQLYQKLRQLVT